MSTNPKENAFQSNYPTVVYMDSDYNDGPPLMTFLEVRPHVEAEELVLPPPYPPTSRFDTACFPRIDRSNPPVECFFISASKQSSNRLHIRFRDIIAQLREQISNIRRGASYLFGNTYRQLTSWDDECWTASEIASGILEAAGVAAGVSAEYETWIAREPFNRWKLMFMEVFLKVYTGLIVMSTSVSEEVDGEWRYFDNKVIIWLLRLLDDFLNPYVANLESCITRWLENVHLWSTRNYKTTMYLGLLGRLPRACSTTSTTAPARPGVAFATPTPAFMSTSTRSRMANRSKSVGRKPLAPPKRLADTPRVVPSSTVVDEPERISRTLRTVHAPETCFEFDDITSTTSSARGRTREPRNLIEAPRRPHLERDRSDDVENPQED